MWASTDASTMATSTSLRTTSTTVVTSSALPVMHASPGSRYTCTPKRSPTPRSSSQNWSTG